MRHVVLALLLLVPALAGCAEDAGLPTGNATPTPTPSATPLPTATPTPVAPADLGWSFASCGWDAGARRADGPDVAAAVVGDDGEARVVRYARGDGNYTVAATSEARLAQPSPSAAAPPLVHAEGALYAYGPSPGSADTAPRLLKLDAVSLEVVASREAQDVVAMAARDGILYVAGERLATFDLDLRPLADIELPLKVGPSGKMAHDILLHGDTAYLLDDVVMPLFILRVDVSDPRAPRVIDRQQIDGGHLPAHFVADGRWLVLENWGGRSGAYEAIHAFPLGDGVAEKRWVISRSTHDMETGGSRSFEGRTIVAALPAEPVWVLTGDGGGDLALGRLTVDVDRETQMLCEYGITLERLADGPSRARIDRAGGVIAASYGDAIVVMDERTGAAHLDAAWKAGGGVLAVAVVG